MNDPAAHNQSLVKIWCKTITNVVSISSVVGQVVGDRLVSMPPEGLESSKSKVSGGKKRLLGVYLVTSFQDTTTFALLLGAHSLAWDNVSHRRLTCFCCLSALVLETVKSVSHSTNAGSRDISTLQLPEEAHILWLSNRKLTCCAVWVWLSLNSGV